MKKIILMLSLISLYSVPALAEKNCLETFDQVVEQLEEAPENLAEAYTDLIFALKDYVTCVDDNDKI